MSWHYKLFPLLLMLTALKSRLHLFLLRIFIFLKEVERWHLHNKEKIGCCVYYGHDHIPLPSESASGGIIKCQDLQIVFPNRFNNANILYLVSSSLPLFPQYLLKNARSKGVKLVWNQNGVAYPAWHGSGWKKTNEISAQWIQKADYVIYQSEFCKLSADRYLGKIEGAWEVLHNPVDTEFFVPSMLPFDGFTILLAGTHNEWYRIQTAVKIFQRVLRKIPDAKLLVAGPLRWRANSSEAKEQLDALCVSLDIKNKLHLFGSYRQDEAVSLFHSAQLLLHTQYNDACPRLVVEAMSCGLPVVYSSTGGTSELVGSEAGIGVDAQLDWERIHTPDPQLMADAVCDVFQKYEFYSKNARKRAVERFDVRPWLRRHEHIFKKVLQ